MDEIEKNEQAEEVTMNEASEEEIENDERMNEEYDEENDEENEEEYEEENDEENEEESDEEELEEAHSFFDEKSPKWIGIFKGWTIFMFVVLILGGVVGCLIAYDWGEDELALACIPVGIMCAFFQLVVNMLIIQLLNNVQIIREKLEEK